MSKIVGISGVSGCSGCQGVGKMYNFSYSNPDLPAVPGQPTPKLKMDVDVPVEAISADVLAATRTERLLVSAGTAVVVLGGVYLIVSQLKR